MAGVLKRGNNPTDKILLGFGAVETDETDTAVGSQKARKIIRDDLRLAAEKE